MSLIKEKRKFVQIRRKSVFL